MNVPGISLDDGITTLDGRELFYLRSGRRHVPHKWT